MRVDAFDFELPDDRIALRPARPRDSARLLVVRPGEGLVDRAVRDLPDLLEPGDALVFNDTKVIPAQLEGVRIREGGRAQVGFTLHMRLSDHEWKAFARGAKKLKAGDRLHFGHDGETCLQGVLDATVTDRGEGGEVTLAFDLAGPMLDEAMAQVGHVPLPPYIALRRGEDAADRTDYQTIYAREEGAVAAPTAGLHFTETLLARIEERRISRHFVTLHVGAGTFLPVKAEDTADHKMHHERGAVSAEAADALNGVRAAGGRIVCVGTTSLRLLESAADETGTIHAWKGA
ncbi:MAG: tRNA preQ1(34) S-adenosylmethionine ribosyltransferase-isomerase QueA, partial [Pseudomonadota bacterium]|nr:tRNA preQ1(34) S-adenosylmethionine ribosyltransferase-isomerase QueA [Pseudomonadota bacterium]